MDNGTLNTNGQYVKCGKLWGTAYYRISQTDFNGITESFQTQSTNCNESTEIYPNPFVDQLIISAEYNGVLTLLDLTGKVIYRSSFEAGKTTISTQGIATGTYIAHLELVNGNYEDVKLVKF